MVDFNRAKTAFTHIYDSAVWGGGSGASDPSITQAYINLIQDFMRNNDIRSVVDVGCGDWQFSRAIDWSGVSYYGFDVVESVIEKNKAEFASSNVNFAVLKSTSDLPPADMVVCKDVLQHLPNEEVLKYLKCFVSLYKYSIITNDIYGREHTPEGDKVVPDEWVNGKIRHGEWRPLKLDLPPFNMKAATLLQWDIDCDTWFWTKRVCILMSRLDSKKRLSFWNR